MGQLIKWHLTTTTKLYFVTKYVHFVCTSYIFVHSKDKRWKILMTVFDFVSNQTTNILDHWFIYSSLDPIIDFASKGKYMLHQHRINVLKSMRTEQDFIFVKRYISTIIHSKSVSKPWFHQLIEFILRLELIKRFVLHNGKSFHNFLENNNGKTSFVNILSRISHRR